MIRLAFLAVLAVPCSVPADEAPFGLALLRPDSLAGWEYGPAGSAGWTVEGGTLRASKGAEALVSGFTFGDFELRLQWSVAPGAALELLLPDVPRGPGLRVRLCEGDRCARVDDAGKTLLPGGKLAPGTGDTMHSAAVRRAGEGLSVSIDGRPFCRIAVAPDRRFGLGLSLEGDGAALSGLRAQEPPGESVFDGRGLDGWWCPDNLQAWQPEGGELVLKPGGGNYLRTRKDYGNFTLSLEYLIVRRGNSGIGIRTPQAGWPSSDGMELQIEDVPGLDKHKTMAVYGNMPPLARADRSGEWNRVVVKADGPMISAWVNGELVQQTNTALHPELKHRRPEGWIGFQDHGGWIRLRDIRVLEAPAGAGLDGWHRPPPPSATATMLDRLMNPERLSVPDGIRAHTAAASVSQETGGAETLLADLAGPGAVVRVARTSDQGRLAFYFDGEARSRLECKAADLWQAVPMLSEDRSPVLTCLTYEKGLKVVLRGAREGAYWIDHVTFPQDMRVESFRSRESGFPRGWLAAVDYRLGQTRWGVIRQNDAMPRFTSPPKKVSPGTTEPLVRVEGAGVVEWLQLQAPKQVLDASDLWLEVTIDGEDSPALASPARFLFPGLAGQGNYSNFTMLERGGQFCRLAMPFGEGISVAARNAGKRAIAGVGLTLCVDPATETNRSEMAGRMRLRGRYLPAGEQAGELARIERAGRWVGLVCDLPDGAAPPIASLEIDGQTREAWSGLPWESFLGQSGPFRGVLSGRSGTLAWRYLLLEPADFEKSLVLKAPGGNVGARLALYYARP